MALYCSLLIFALVVAIAPEIAFAREYMVGGDYGWTLAVNYTAWAEGKQFVVGDSLVFIYPKGAHDVFKVNGTEFQSCIIPKNNSMGFFSGNDTISLTTAGKKWYICGVNGHCEAGQKLSIDVLSSAPAPTPN